MTTFRAQPHDPQAALDYEMDWSAWLAEGETITDQTVECAQDDVTISLVTETAGIVRWRVAGGTVGTDGVVTVGITTSAGRIDERSIRIPFRAR